jgi:conjugal transfer pilus assembly protein TraE
MDSSRYDDDLEQSAAQNKRLALVAGALGLCLLLSLVIILNMLGRERTIVSPPALKQSFWLTSSTASASYIEEMSLWISSLILDVTPDDVAYKSKLLLQYAHPESHGKLKERQDLEIARLKRDNLSTYFVLATVHANADQLSAVLTGKLHTLINGARVADQERHFLVKWRMDGGRAHLVEFAEASQSDVNKLLNPNAHAAQ